MSADTSPCILVTVTGRDAPGITAALTQIIAETGGTLFDIEQVVVQGQLTLCLLLSGEEGPRPSSVIKELLFRAKEMGLDLDFRVIDSDRPARTPANYRRYAITAIGDRIDARDLHDLAATVARHKINIDGIHRLSDDEMSSIEIVLSVPPDDETELVLRKELLELAARLDIDVALQREKLTRRSKRLIVMDMDSTLIRIEVIDELARMWGVGEQVAEVTRRAMAGQMPFEQSLAERVGKLAGMPYQDVLRLASDLPVTEGAEDLLMVLRGLGYKTAVISGGFTFAAEALRQRLGLDYAYANQLEVKDGKLTGRVLDPIVGPQRKADLLDAIAQRENIPLDQTIAIGDGANDLLMLQQAGLGIAFHAKPKLKAAADTSISAGGLDRILYLLGLRARDVREFLEEGAR